MAKSSSLIFLAACLLLAGCASSGGPYERAVEQYGRGHIDESVSQYRQAARETPLDPRPKFNLAVIYQDEGRLDEAEKLYRQILEKHSDYSPAWANIASIQERRGRAVEAEKSYRRALEADRDNPWTASQFGFFLLRAGRLDEAGPVFEQALKRGAKCSNAWFGLGEIAEKKGDSRAALKNYGRALLYNPSDIEACVRSAQLRADTGDRDSAIGLLQRAVKIDSRRGDVHFRLGRLLSEQGRWKEAERAFEQAAKNGVPKADCDRELSVVYAKLAEEAAGKSDPPDMGTPN